MVNIIIKISLLLCLLITPLIHVFADHDETNYPHVPNKIVVTSDDWCPYTCTSLTNRPGVMYDLVKSVLDHAGKEFDFKKASWPRAIEMVANDNAHILLGANPDLANKAGFHTFKQFYLSVESAFLVRKSMNKTRFDEDEFNDLTIGLMKFYQYDKSGGWDELLKSHNKTVEVDNHLGETHLITLLQKRRIDAALINIDVAKHFLSSWGLADDYKFVRKDIRIPIYVAFNQSDMGEMVFAMFNEEFEAMQANGSLSGVLEKYDILMPNINYPMINLLKAENPLTSE